MIFCSSLLVFVVHLDLKTMYLSVGPWLYWYYSLLLEFGVCVCVWLSIDDFKYYLCCRANVLTWKED